jgi:hypothetical protein
MPSPIKVTTANREIITAIRKMQSLEVRVEEEMRKTFSFDPYDIFIFAKDVATFSAALIAIIKAIKSVKEETQIPTSIAHLLQHIFYNCLISASYVIQK